ncbi:MAG: D-glycero-beta-D-manno-heptose 1-phosphate adenylyltransferase [Planctomycetaceae bacterium]
MRVSLHTSIDSLRDVRILVFGDVMLDRYVFGNVDRISPEAPVGVLVADEYKVRPGGAAGVATFAQALNARVSLAAVTGNDPDNLTLRKLCEDSGIDTSLLLSSDHRITTRKERFVGRASERHPYQMLRVDHEISTVLASEDEYRLDQMLTGLLSTCDAILVSDYSKGVCTKGLIRKVIAAAAEREIPVVVDPGRNRPVDTYRGATVLKPNRHEASSLWGRSIISIDDAAQAAREIRLQCKAQCVVITLDREGCVVADPAGSQHLPTLSRDVYDICGAGDMFLAMLGVSLANGQPMGQAAELANLAAGMEVEQQGTFALTIQEIKSSLTSTSDHGLSALLTVPQLLQRLSHHRLERRRVVFTNGCFDLLHPGHIRSLQEAARMGEILVVAINSDAGIRKLKGPERPIINEQQRAAMLSALSCVDYVVVFDDPTPHRLLAAIRPDVLVKGGAYAHDEVVGREIVEEYGGKIAVTSHVEGLSTTSLVTSLRGSMPCT